jgi:hypothetical protein
MNEKLLFVYSLHILITLFVLLAFLNPKTALTGSLAF